MDKINHLLADADVILEYLRGTTKKKVIKKIDLIAFKIKIVKTSKEFKEKLTEHRDLFRRKIKDKS